METIPFLSSAQAQALRAEFASPLYVYDEATLAAQARRVLAFPNRYGLTARFAMKALPNASVLRLFGELGLHIDASSAYEVERAVRAGIAPAHIMLTAQQPAEDLAGLAARGVRFNACSLHQLRLFGQACPGREVSVRVNPGLGSGHSNRTNVGGPSSSFGIWHEHLEEALAIAKASGLRITAMHSHIGSGGDPEVWRHCATLSLGIAARLPEVTRISLGGGFKVGRMPGEPSADLHAIGEALVPHFEAFAREQGRELHLEIEPGTYLVANAGAIVATVVDIVDTGEGGGYTFLKTDTGMTENARPSLYGAQHPIELAVDDAGARARRDYVIAGHCCESGDILTPEPGNPEGLLPRTLPEARIGDCLVIGGAGAYCASMSSKNYNSFPEAAEVLLQRDGAFRCIRRRQPPEQVIANEC